MASDLSIFEPGLGALFGVGGSPGFNAPDVSAVERLLTMLPMLQAQQAPKRRPIQNILGALADALTTYGTVRAGGTPQPGQFATRVATERAGALEETRNVEKFNRDLEARVRIGAFEREQEAQAAKEVARIRASRPRPTKIEFTREVAGQSRRFTRFVDPTTQEVVPIVNPTTGELEYEQDLGPAGYAPATLPGMVVEKGKPPRASLLQIPKGATGPAREVAGPGGARVEPPPPVALAAEAGGKAGVLAGLPRLMEIYNQVDAEVRGTGELDRWWNWAKAQTAGTRLQPVAMPANLQRYYNEVRAILAPYVRSVSGLVFPESELRRYEARMPIPGVTPPENLEAQWDSLIQEMVRDIQAKYGAAGRATPGLPGGAATADPAAEARRRAAERLRSLVEGGNP